MRGMNTLMKSRLSAGKPVLTLLLLGLMLYLSVARIGGAEPQHRGPPLSTTALFSSFAREQGLAPESFIETIQETIQPPADAAALTPGEIARLQAAGADIKVNQDFSLRPQNETDRGFHSPTRLRVHTTGT